MGGILGPWACFLFSSFIADGHLRRSMLVSLVKPCLLVDPVGSIAFREQLSIFSLGVMPGPGLAEDARPDYLTIESIDSFANRRKAKVAFNDIPSIAVKAAV